MRLKFKEKRWLNKTLNIKNKYNHVDASLYQHEKDKLALNALKKIPLFDKVVSKFVDLIKEYSLDLIDISSSIRISDKQIPRVYYMVLDISKKLGIEMPALYLNPDRNPNAFTYGDKKATITITAGLLECMDDLELYAVLAHECGHIACKHVLYHTIGSIILHGSFLGLSKLNISNTLLMLVTKPLEIAFYYWMRCSELSADRAAIICCENAIPVVKTMMGLAGAINEIKKEVNIEEFINQTKYHKDLLEESKIKKFVELFMIKDSTHPLLAVRASEASGWYNTSEYKSIIDRMKGKKQNIF